MRSSGNGAKARLGPEVAVSRCRCGSEGFDSQQTESRSADRKEEGV